ncbi:hybrid sensor histidine kinase/response regulator [Psychromonas sp. L1A2]|uniref:hybrid sensor histidine kinase/response regulator n=1 Tax=Psychromonas sp. L1A2 TaxID=2686356 RepID=UPI001359639F|nr:hybrid sensor histidine kinase/response regulator [Psychromonas sp. L1A2]
MQEAIPTQSQLRWQSLRPFNVIILCSFVFFFLIGIGQSYTIFDTSPTFIMPFFIPVIILLLSIANLIGVILKKDKIAQILMPINCLSITFFVTINSHFQEHLYVTSFLYLVLLLPLFYSYLFAYSTTHLATNNIFLVVCYIVAVIVGTTDALAFLFNSTFLITMCYLTIFTQLRSNKKANKQPVEIRNEQPNIINQKTGDYLKRIIHDIRQPLSSLSLYGHLLENKLTGTPQLQLAKNIKLASEELDRWLSSLLDLARMDSDTTVPQISEFTLASTLLPSIKKYQFQAFELGIQIITRLPNLTIKTDKRLFIEIIETLLNNAIIHGSQKKGTQILLSVRHYQGKALIQVWNQGAKIETSLLGNLFDEISLADNPLHNKSKGIGLGLPIAQRKAILCDTKIEVISNQRGSRFSFAVNIAENTNKPINLNKLSNHSIDYKILLIDDDQGILHALSMLLENWGYTVECADTAEEGLEKYYLNNYDLVISDYRLPNQKTGLDVIKKIKEQDDIPAVLLTGEADPGKLKEVQTTGKEINYKILNKPVKPASLRFLLKQLLK